MKTPLLALLAIGLCAGQPFRAAGAGFLRGADVSFLPRLEAAGAVFRRADQPVPCLTILRDHGLDTVRLRLWHRPADGHSGLAEVLSLAERAQGAGFAILLDLHYSDTWADPGHQTKPAAWSGLDWPVLCDSVRTYTRDVLAACAARGVRPAIVQLGNEITPGMLWHEGRVDAAFDTPAQWDRLAALLRAARAGVDAALPLADRPEVMIHLDRGGDNAGARRFLDEVLARGVDFDLVGLSYYPWWHGGLDALAGNLADLAVRYGKDLVVVETAYPWTLGWFDDTHNPVGLPQHLLPDFPATPPGQRAFLAAVLAAVAAVPGGHGRGVVWWEPEWIAAPGFGSSWENLTLFDETGRPLPALEAFSPAAAAGTPRAGTPRR